MNHKNIKQKFFYKLQRFVTGLFAFVLISCVSAAVKDIWKENALSGADDNLLLRKLRLSPSSSLSSSASASAASSSYNSKSSEGYNYPKPAVPFVIISLNANKNMMIFNNIFTVCNWWKRSLLL